MLRKGILFDLDGTMWDAVSSITKAWNQALEHAPDISRTLSEADLMGIMGLQLSEIGRALLPEVSPQRANALMKQCVQIEQEHLSQSGGILYPHLEETLAALSKNYFLGVVSNCPEGYIEVFLTYHRLQRYFSDFACAGATQRPKGENISLVIARNHLDRVVYVGDTQGDCNAARQAGIPFIHASYGFGRVSAADAVITDLSQLPHAMEMIEEAVFS